MNMKTIIMNHADAATALAEHNNLEQTVGINPEQMNNNGFIEANTTVSSIAEIKNNHIIPVFTKDNEAVINHTDFIEAAYSAVATVFGGDAGVCQNSLSVKVSHAVKGRIPEVKLKQ